METQRLLEFIERYRPSLWLPDGWVGRPFDNAFSTTWSQVRGRRFFLELSASISLIMLGHIGLTLEEWEGGYALAVAPEHGLVVISEGMDSTLPPKVRCFSDGCVRLCTAVRPVWQ